MSDKKINLNQMLYNIDMANSKWFNTLESEIQKLKPDSGVIYIGNADILEKICPGVYGTIKPIGICMIGIK